MDWSKSKRQTSWKSNHFVQSWCSHTNWVRSVRFNKDGSTAITASDYRIEQWISWTHAWMREPQVGKPSLCGFQPICLQILWRCHDGRVSYIWWPNWEDGPVLPGYPYSGNYKVLLPSTFLRVAEIPYEVRNTPNFLSMQADGTWWRKCLTFALPFIRFVLPRALIQRDGILWWHWEKSLCPIPRQGIWHQFGGGCMIEQIDSLSSRWDHAGESDLLVTL